MSLPRPPLHQAAVVVVVVVARAAATREAAAALPAGPAAAFRLLLTRVRVLVVCDSVSCLKPDGKERTGNRGRLVELP